MPEKAETMEVIDKLHNYCTLEQIAVEVEKTWGTIWRWSKGLGIPGKGDFELLKSLLKRKEQGDETKV